MSFKQAGILGNNRNDIKIVSGDLCFGGNSRSWCVAKPEVLDFDLVSSLLYYPKYILQYPMIFC